MDERDAVGLIITLVLANWAAIGAALKCRDKIDGARNLIWGIATSNPPQSKDMMRFIYREDILLISGALVLVLLGVGSLLIMAYDYMSSQEKIPFIIAQLYGLTGLGMVVGSFITLLFAMINVPKIKRIALMRLEHESSSNGD